MFELSQIDPVLANLVFSAVVALSTGVYAVLTAQLVSETRRMRRAQTDPRLVAFVEPREEFVNFGHLYIRNIGAGPAFQISFEFRPLSGEVGAKMLIDDFSKSRFLATGVEYLGPGQQLQSQYTAFAENYNEKIKAILEVTMRYTSAGGQRFTSTQRIDMSEFEGRGGLGKPHLYAIAQSLEKLEREISSLVSGFRKMRVEVFTHEDRERERVEWEAHREAHRRKAQPPQGAPDAPTANSQSSNRDAA